MSATVQSQGLEITLQLSSPQLDDRQCYCACPDEELIFTCTIRNQGSNGVIGWSSTEYIRSDFAGTLLQCASIADHPG